MSLHYLGISHFPVLHRQFSSPNTKLSPESPPDQDLTQDNKDVLVERLNDLVLRLSKDGSLGNTAVTAIHKEVDYIELLMRGGENRPTSAQSSFNESLSHGIRVVEKVDNDIFWGPPTPTRNARMRLPDQWTNSHHQSGSEITTSRAAELTTVAETLVSQLTQTVAEFQARKEESKVGCY